VLLVWRELTHVSTGGAVYGVSIDSSGVLGPPFLIDADSYPGRPWPLTAAISSLSGIGGGHDPGAAHDRRRNTARRRTILLGDALLNADIVAAWNGQAYLAV
jgi:hypothetical protein